MRGKILYAQQTSEIIWLASLVLSDFTHIKNGDFIVSQYQTYNQRLILNCLTPKQLPISQEILRHTSKIAEGVNLWWKRTVRLYIHMYIYN